MFACFFLAVVSSFPAQSGALDIPAFQRVLKDTVDSDGLGDQARKEIHVSAAGKLQGQVSEILLDIK